MNSFLTRARYYLEIISVPIFAFLVIHLAGHGLMLLKEADHDHEDHGDHEAGFDLDFLLSTEFLGGLLALLFFVWCWHQRPLKQLVPCSHDQCRHTRTWPHLAASLAFVIHFFAESGIRYELWSEFELASIFSLLGIVGFAGHFLVDIIVMILLSQFWPQTWQKYTSLAVMIGLWLASFALGSQGGLHVPGVAEPVILLISAFLLAMFVHKPHKPTPACTC